MAYTTVLLQTITEVEGEGLNSPTPLNLSYTVPQGCTAGVQYVRAGSTVTGMLNITLLQNGKVMRYIPVAAGSATHVPLSIVDELQPGTEVSVAVAAEGSGTLILDIGVLEVNTA
ncbi:MAG: molybdopterin oxidoreductase [Rubrobacter sp.]|nr:molybdopterin oxidoreductase [Rubrobacter sp.]